MTCRWPRGCDMPVSLIPDEGGVVGLCGYHWKVTPEPVGGGLIGFEHRRHTRMNPADVASAEREELLDVLVALGVPKRQARAMVRR